MTRFRIAWKALRGRAVMYRCALVLDVERDRLIVGCIPEAGGLVAIGNRATLGGVAHGEVLVFDCRNDLTYPLHVDGTMP